MAFHSQQVAPFGGSDGVRDAGLLESALARPKNLFAYSEAEFTMADLAAAYAFGISSNHPFVDRNKQTAMQMAFVFLEFNGFPVTASQEEACLTFSEPRVRRDHGSCPRSLVSKVFLRRMKLFRNGGRIATPAQSHRRASFIHRNSLKCAPIPADKSLGEISAWDRKLHRQ